MKVPTIAKSRKMVLWGCVCILYGAVLVVWSDKSELPRFFWPALIWAIVLGRISKRLGYSQIFWVAAGMGGGILAAVPLWEHGGLWRTRWTRVLGMIAFVLFLSLAAQQLQLMLDPTKERDENAVFGTGVLFLILGVLWVVGMLLEGLRNRLKGRVAFPLRQRWKYPMTNGAKVGLVVAAILAISVSWWWLRPPPESFTQRLRRECQETLAYTHPEWDETVLSRMTKGCVDRRLLLSPHP